MPVTSDGNPASLTQCPVFGPAGHLSYRQMESVREVLRSVGTWDLVRLHCGDQLKGDFQGCQYIALDRQDTDTLEFSRVKTLSADALWSLLGHVPQVSLLHRGWGTSRTRLSKRVEWRKWPAGGSSTVWLWLGWGSWKKNRFYLASRQQLKIQFSKVLQIFIIMK